MNGATFSIDRRMKAKIAAVVVIAFLTLSFFAVGFTAMEEAKTSPAAAAADQTVAENDENAAVAAFKWV